MKLSLLGLLDTLSNTWLTKSLVDPVLNLQCCLPLKFLYDFFYECLGFMNHWSVPIQHKLCPNPLKLQDLCGFVCKLHIMRSFQVLYYSSSLMPPQPCHRAFAFAKIHCYQNFEIGCTAVMHFFFPFLGLLRKTWCQTWWQTFSTFS